MVMVLNLVGLSSMGLSSVGLRQSCCKVGYQSRNCLTAVLLDPMALNRIARWWLGRAPRGFNSSFGGIKNGESRNANEVYVLLTRSRAHLRYS